MSAMAEVVQTYFDETDEAIVTAFRVLRRYFDVTNRGIAEALDRKEYWVQQRTSGTTHCKPGDLRAFAHVFQVPVDLFWWDPPEIRRWLAEHHPDPQLLRSRWSRDNPQAA